MLILVLELGKVLPSLSFPVESGHIFFDLSLARRLIGLLIRRVIVVSVAHRVRHLLVVIANIVDSVRKLLREGVTLAAVDDRLDQKMQRSP